MEFDYDPAKSASNPQKHGINFDKLSNSGTILTAENYLPVPQQNRLIMGEIQDQHGSAIITDRPPAPDLISVQRDRGDRFNTGFRYKTIPRSCSLMPGKSRSMIFQTSFKSTLP